MEKRTPRTAEGCRRGTWPPRGQKGSGKPPQNCCVKRKEYVGTCSVSNGTHCGWMAKKANNGSAKHVPPGVSTYVALEFAFAGCLRYYKTSAAPLDTTSSSWKGILRRTLNSRANGKKSRRAQERVHSLFLSLTIPRLSCLLSGWNSSGNGPPQMLSPPLPVPRGSPPWTIKPLIFRWNFVPS